MRLSIQRGTMHSCICVPIWRSGEIAGFLHTYTVSGQSAPFTRRDAQLIQLLGGVASLLINRAADAEQRSRWCAAAAAGEAISGLSHDAEPILDTLGKNMLGVEKQIPQVIDNPSWQLVERDLTFLRHITRDAIRRARGNLGDLRPKNLKLRPVVDEVFDMSKQYYLDLVHHQHVTFVNACQDSHSALIDREALEQALINCIKNCLCPLRESWTRNESRLGTIQIVSCDDPQARRQYRLLSVCDDSGGIPKDVLRHLGNPFVSGRNSKGLGLGMYIISEVIGRMGGYVQVASSTEPAGALPAGTVVSLRLPKTEEVSRQSADMSQPRITVLQDYTQYRTHIEGFLSQGE